MITPRKGIEQDEAMVQDEHDDLPDDLAFERFPREITMLIGWFVTHHMHHLYKRFGGDMTLALILGEIAHHNISPFVKESRIGDKGDTIGWDLGYLHESLEPCNPFSISEATGIPRETCRRKVEKLVECGYIRKHPNGGYTIVEGISDHFRDFNRKAFQRWMAVTRDMQKLVEAAKREQPEGTPST